MPKKYYLLSISLLFCLLGTAGAGFSKTMLKVCILKSTGSVKVSGSGGWRLTDASSRRRLAGGDENQTAVVARNGRFLSVSGRGRYLRLRLAPAGRGALVVVNGRRYRGTVHFRADDGSCITVVNEVELEDYLYGVIKEEMYITSPPEALKAQAVMSRTYALKNRGRHGKAGYDICATTHCQVYGGVESEDPRAKRAVDHTRGYVLMYQGDLIKAFCTSVCGGHTSANHLVWNGKAIPYLGGVRCPYCHDSPHFVWEVTFTGEELAGCLRGAGFELDRVDALEPVEVTSSGRIRTLRIHHPEGQFIVGGNAFRLAVDPRAIKSTRFTVTSIQECDYGGKIEELLEQMQQKKTGQSSDRTVRDIIGLIRARRGDESSETFPEKPPSVEAREYFLFQGKGYGHGVGLCQWGARNMGKRGDCFQKILKHYYPGVKVKLRR
ncbi:MAG: SpoIID/LytB domain-containing protein [Gemmatimonadota bacterium]|nr:SpoIID/LytB domain-containing protein [Gemmatimonadota bacterium]